MLVIATCFFMNKNPFLALPGGLLDYKDFFAKRQNACQAVAVVQVFYRTRYHLSSYSSAEKKNIAFIGVQRGGDKENLEGYCLPL